MESATEAQKTGLGSEVGQRAEELSVDLTPEEKAELDTADQETTREMFLIQLQGFVGKERALEVKCIQVDLKRKTINPIIELEKHLKFNPWEELNDRERNNALQELGERFSDQEILEKIIEPLVENLIKSSL